MANSQQECAEQDERKSEARMSESPGAGTTTKKRRSTKTRTRTKRTSDEPSPAPPSPEELQEQLLAQIAYAGSHCAEIERAFGQNPPPQLETLIKLYRVLILKLAGEGQANPDQLKLAMSLMKPVLDWERFEDARNERQQAQQKEREAQEAARNREAGEDALRPETLDQIERELSLL